MPYVESRPVAHTADIISSDFDPVNNEGDFIYTGEYDTDVRLKYYQDDYSDLTIFASSDDYSISAAKTFGVDGSVTLIGVASNSNSSPNFNVTLSDGNIKVTFANAIDYFGGSFVAALYYRGKFIGRFMQSADGTPVETLQSVWIPISLQGKTISTASSSSIVWDEVFTVRESSLQNSIGYFPFPGNDVNNSFQQIELQFNWLGEIEQSWLSDMGWGNGLVSSEFGTYGVKYVVTPGIDGEITDVFLMVDMGWYLKFAEI